MLGRGRGARVGHTTRYCKVHYFLFGFKTSNVTVWLHQQPEPGRHGSRFFKPRAGLSNPRLRDSFENQDVALPWTRSRLESTISRLDRKIQCVYLCVCVFVHVCVIFSRESGYFSAILSFLLHTSDAKLVIAAAAAVGCWLLSWMEQNVGLVAWRKTIYTCLLFTSVHLPEPVQNMSASTTPLSPGTCLTFRYHGFDQRSRTASRNAFATRDLTFSTAWRKGKKKSREK